jgi:predicted esterase
MGQRTSKQHAGTAAAMVQEQGRRLHRSTIISAVILVALTGCSSSLLSSSAAPPHEQRLALPGTLDSAPSGAEVLEVPGFLPAVLVVPNGVGTRPLVVAAHGAGGAPEWECDYWARLTAEQAFVLCLRGTRISPRAGFYFRNHLELDAELTAALAAARLRFPRIAPNSGIYAGFSQGASMGALIVDRHAAELPYVVLIEGFQQWNVLLGRAFAKRGGKAVLFACGTRECANTAEASVQALQRAGPRARAEYATGAGHTPAGQVEGLVASGLPWLLEDDAAWR